MKNQNRASAIMALLILAFVVLACSVGDETEQANKLVDEGNAGVEETHKLATAAEEKKTKMLAQIAGINSEAELTQARATAKEVIASFDQLKAKFNEVANKFTDAGKLKVNDKFKEYLALKSKEYQKRGEAAETAKASAQALIDSDSRSDFQSKTKASSDTVDKLLAEAKDLGEQAEKFQKENKEAFKS